ncbi:hypothetical protein E0W68_07715 [Flavobacterium salilacus subsp. salilacus]|uniref:hypothetical protein n=1 Tax=Flavobacterium TaxID=237 RepID=UPI0010750A84|nr:MULTISPECIES: hypothetical protein [Flavobacterium]KAF2518634.1 hypothetical protein E0W68_07715 [Flavobacterium salilacus subsp. salilacus]MBE1613595.1 hypothetical protein [Flavobacterium sp. SaA2.13]
MDKISYQRLLESKPIEEITYQNLLFTTEWERTRKRIIERDGKRCRKCNYSATGSYAHFDKEKNLYSYLTDDGTEEKQSILDNNGFVIDVEIPRLVVTYKPYHLQVHHKYYIFNKLPWEYKDDALITLCNWCHSELHIESNIEIFDNESFANSQILIPCGRCNGTGWFEQYNHIQGGVCFKCLGKRFTTPLISF